MFDRIESLHGMVLDMTPRLRQLQEQSCPRPEPHVMRSTTENLGLQFLPITIKMRQARGGELVTSDDGSRYLLDGELVKQQLERLEFVLTESTSNYNLMVSC
jgi:hypothetical protein